MLAVHCQTKAEDMPSVTFRNKSNHKPGNGNVQIVFVCVAKISKFFLCDLEK
jgi:hypothetical protein